jgi:hypothetical protein
MGGRLPVYIAIQLKPEKSFPWKQEMSAGLDQTWSQVTIPSVQNQYFFLIFFKLGYIKTQCDALFTIHTILDIVLVKMMNQCVLTLF